MAIDSRTEMSADETAAFLGRQETGVLALARADEPYAIPVSYGFDAGRRRFFLRLVSTPDSEKRRFLASEPTARLVVYEGEDAVGGDVAPDVGDDVGDGNAADDVGDGDAADEVSDGGGHSEIYRSVVAVGTLQHVDPAALTVEDIEQYGSAERPLFEIWPHQKGDLDIELYTLTPERLSGRLVEVDRGAGG